MKIKLMSLLVFCAIAVLLGFNFFNRSTTTPINYNNPVQKFNLSMVSAKKSIGELIAFTGVKHLDSTFYALDNLQNIFITSNQMVAFDGRTDYIERLCFFDQTGGKLVNEVHFPKFNDGELASIRSVSYAPKEKCFYALAGGRQSIMKYAETGELMSEVVIGMYGSRMEVLEDGTFLVEAGLNEAVESGYHRLLLFDQKGNILQRFFPYKAQPEEFLMSDCGILSKIGATIHYSWPFNDTVYTYVNGVFSPELIASFERDAVSEDDRLSAEIAKNGSYIKNSFLLSDFALFNNLMIFAYLNGASQKALAFINTQTGEYVNSRDAIPDELSGILMSTDIVGFDGETIIFQITSKRAKRILSVNGPDIDKMKKDSPGMYTALTDASLCKNPSLFYFKVRP
jgi:hypothetical protein